MPSLCADCKTNVISAHGGTHGVCLACVPMQVNSWKEWTHFMTHRFRRHLKMMGT